ncbi:hypothetical protein M0638_12675 [Roseomonas sp. NAR14]|uniref:Uncharacterized protein n=1 Tax=Roseomonas acroporae TaxID=2937791 RepID=A0A9X1YA81_9PROT|nr:hypothetical protein [Roseomonas acroporae]MCK8785240.1 hypothetical protein [Roseomonas acroporae]
MATLKAAARRSRKAEVAVATGTFTTPPPAAEAPASEPRHYLDRIAEAATATDLMGICAALRRMERFRHEPAWLDGGTDEEGDAWNNAEELLLDRLSKLPIITPTQARTVLNLGLDWFFEIKDAPAAEHLNYPDPARIYDVIKHARDALTATARQPDPASSGHVAMLAELRAIQARQDLWNDDKLPEAEGQADYEAWWRVVKRAIATPPTTQADVVAMAHMFPIVLDSVKGPTLDPQEAFALTLVNGIIGGAAPAPARPAKPCPVEALGREWKRLDDAVAGEWDAGNDDDPRHDRDRRILLSRMLAAENETTWQRARTPLGALFQAMVTMSQVRKLEDLRNPEAEDDAEKLVESIERLLQSLCAFLEDSFSVSRRDVGVQAFLDRDLDPHARMAAALAEAEGMA